MKRLTVEKEKHGSKRVYIASCQDGCIYKAFCEEAGCNCTEVSAIIARLAEIENIISDENDEYDLDRIKVIFEQKISLRKEAAERFKITKNIPIERLREIVKEYKDGRSD